MDPVRDAAFRKAEAALEKLQYYGDFEQLRRCLPALAHPSQSVIFVVDAQTSKMPIILQMVDKVNELAESLLTKKVAVLVPVGARLDVLGVVANKCLSTWSKYFFVVNLGRDLEI